jgi:hypothetical protein
MTLLSIFPQFQKANLFSLLSHNYKNNLLASCANSTSLGERDKRIMSLRPAQENLLRLHLKKIIIIKKGWGHNSRSIAVCIATTRLWFNFQYEEEEEEEEEEEKNLFSLHSAAGRIFLKYFSNYVEYNTQKEELTFWPSTHILQKNHYLYYLYCILIFSFLCFRF